MTKMIEVSGKTEEEAIAAGLEQLGMTRDEVSVEVVERSKKGVLGFGRTDAVVRLSYEVEDEAPVAPAAPAAPTAPAAKTAKPAPVPAAGTQRERVEHYLRGLLDCMGVEAEIEITERENGGLVANLTGPAMGAIIGRRGETLDAIQHLVNYSVNRGSEKMHISVDAENYRSKREESLVRLAEKMAAKAVKYKRSMALEPMNSYERHVIHTALQNYEGVSTASTGVEPNRRVVVTYEKPETPASSGKPQSREWA